MNNTKRSIVERESEKEKEIVGYLTEGNGQKNRKLEEGNEMEEEMDVPGPVAVFVGGVGK